MIDAPADQPQRDRALTAFALVVGFCVWIQVLGTSLWTEVQLEDGRFIAVFLDVLPLLVLGVGAAIRSRFALLAAFTLSFVPGVLYAPDAAIAQLYADLGMLRIAGTTALYIVGVTLAFAKRDAPATVPTQPNPKGTHHRVVWTRAVLAFGLFVFGVLQPIHFDSIVSRTIGQTYDNAEIAANFISITVFFLWVVGTYMFIVVPSLNYEHDKRVLKQKFEVWQDDPNGGLLRRNAFELGVLATFGILLVL